MQFGSIPVENLPSLIECIKTDFNIWINESHDSNLKPPVWTGLSGDIQQFLKRNNTPFEKYKQRFYSPLRHTIAASYVWQHTSLLDIAAEFAKPEYRKGLVFIDILLVPQQNVESEQVVGTTTETYSDCWVVAFVRGGYLRRAWCCCELAVATKHQCKITVVGTCDQVVGRDFFGKMEATVPNDIKLIETEILKEHGTAQAFNDIVACAMEVLFVAAAKNKHCELFKDHGLRHERIGWITKLQSTNPQEQPRDQQRDWEVLIGNMSHASVALNRSLTVCLVSTLTDTMLEWSFFLQDCVPYLKKCALKRGLDLVISDMRRGCRDEDSVTPEIALAELQRCKAESAAVCFLVISGDKYGHRPIPACIPKAEFDDLVSKMKGDDADRVQGYYLLDENQLNQDKCPAPSYVLQADISSEFVDRCAFLSNTFRAAARQLWPYEELRNPKSKHPIKSFFTSQVEMELFQGIFCEPVDAQDVHVYIRSFQPESLNFDTSPVIGIYTNKQDDQESIQLLRDLQGTMIPGVLKPECITRFEIAFQEGINPYGAQARSARKGQLSDSDALSLLQDLVRADDHRTYLCKFLDHSCDVVVRSLDKLEQRLAVKPSPLVDEIRLHLDFAQFRGQRFWNTPSSMAALIKVHSYLSGKGGQTYVLWAPSGAGKTYVMAKAAVLGEGGDAPRGTVVMRFLGTSSKSSDALSLLQSICQQLRTISLGKRSFTEGQHNQISGLDPCPTSYEELCKYLKIALECWSWGPLSIFLDSVDQLDDTNSGRNLAWLPLEGYSDQVHIVVSTLPDEIKPEVGRPFRCLSTLQQGLKEENFVQVEALQEPQELLCHLLRLKARCATPDQVYVIVKALRNAENKAQTPLMATLLAHLASGWNSFSKTPFALPSSVREIILEFFQILEKKHGETLVRHVLCLITLAKQGLSVSELQELLSLDDDALAASFEWWVTPQLKMPSAPLLLLLTDLAPFLSKRSVLILWYHRQLWEGVEAIFLMKPEARAAFHRILADFFCGRWSGDQKKPCNENLCIRLGKYDASRKTTFEQGGCRHVRDQPYHLKGTSALHPGAEYNNRRCVEALYQMVKELEIRTQDSDTETVTAAHMYLSDSLSECLKMAAEELCSVNGVCARSMVGEEFNLVSQCAKIAEISDFKGSPMNATIVKQYYRWIRRETHEFKSQGQIVASLLRQPDMSVVRELYLASKLRIPGVPAAVFGNSTDFDAVISILKGHTNGVQSVSCEGNHIASGSDDQRIIIWDAKTGNQVSTLKGHTSRVTSVAWRHGGDQIASASYDKTIIVWDANTGYPVLTLKGHTEAVTSVAWRPGADRIDDEARKEFRGKCRPSSCDQIASGSCDNTIIIWNTKTGEQISKLKGHKKWVQSVAWLPGFDQIASGSEDKTIIIWDTKTGEQLSTLKGHTSYVTSVAWRLGGDQIASGSLDNTVMIWDAKTGDQLLTLKGHTLPVMSVAWSPGGDKLASGSNDKTVIIWDVFTGNKISTLKGHSDYVRGVAWRPKGNEIASGSEDNTIIIWDAVGGEQISTLKGHPHYVTSVAWCPGGKHIASGSRDETIIVWDAKSADQILTLKGHSDTVTGVAWRPGGDQIASAAEDQKVIIWDAKTHTGAQVLTLIGHSAPVTSLAWRPGGDQIGGYDQIGDAPSCCCPPILSRKVRPEKTCPGGDQIASGSRDKTIIIWDAKTGEQVSKLKGHTEPVTSVAWNPEGDRIASAAHDKTIIIWDPKTAVQVSMLRGHTKAVTSVAWHPGVDQIASGSEDKTITIWDALTGKHLLTLKGHSSAVLSVAWHREGNQIASGSHDKTIIIWDAKTGNQISTLKGHSSAVVSVAWSPGGDQIASGSNDNTVIIWDVNAAVPAAVAGSESLG